MQRDCVSILDGGVWNPRVELLTINSLRRQHPCIPVLMKASVHGGAGWGQGQMDGRMLDASLFLIIQGQDIAHIMRRDTKSSWEATALGTVLYCCFHTRVYAPDAKHNP